MPLVTVAIEAVIARQALVYGRHLAGDGTEHTEYLCEGDLPVNVGKEMRRNLRMASFPIRKKANHEVDFDNHSIWLSVVDLGKSDDREAFAIHVAGPSYNIIDDFFNASKKYCEDLAVAPRATQKIHRFLYNQGYWERLGDASKRATESVFLNEDAKDLVSTVVRFMTDPAVKEKHNRFGVPFKMNVLLHGPPGTGKTTLIESVAGRLGSDIFLVQFTDRLRDADLAVALRRVSDHPNPIIVMEDVDCVFSDRKKHDSTRNAITMSGFLNALDGMSRPEGSVLFMTTNEAECLDPAITRSRRIDRVLHMTYADEAQTADMIRSFFPDTEQTKVELFCERTSFHPYTTAELNEYLFSCCSDSLPDPRDFIRWCKTKGSGRVTTEAHNPMYM